MRLRSPIALPLASSWGVQTSPTLPLPASSSHLSIRPSTHCKIGVQPMLADTPALCRWESEHVAGEREDEENEQKKQDEQGEQTMLKSRGQARLRKTEVGYSRDRHGVLEGGAGGFSKIEANSDRRNAEGVSDRGGE